MWNLMAYVDPATTALIWQILAGVFISLGVVFAIWWRKITTFFKSIWVKVFRRGQDTETNKDDIEADEELGQDFPNKDEDKES